MADSKKDPVLEIEANFREEDELSQLKNSDDIDKLRSILEEGEVVYRLVQCYHDDSDGVLAATNRRIVFADQRFITSKVVSYQYSEVAAIAYNDQLVTHAMTLLHSSRPLTVTKVDKEHGDRFLTFIHKAIGADYTLEGSGRIFRHNDDMLQIGDMPNMADDLKDSITSAQL